MTCSFATRSGKQMIYTKFRTLTDAELLSVVQTARLYSPIIEELARRVEQAKFDEGDALTETWESAEKPRAFSCPVCEVNLLGSVNLIDDCFVIKIKQ